jgi:hypothetical protein
MIDSIMISPQSLQVNASLPLVAHSSPPRQGCPELAGSPHA